MKGRIIIVEGPKGAGKTTVTNWMRENISPSNLYRLSGIPGNDECVKRQVYTYYEQLLTFLYEVNGTKTTHIFDRIFITEYIYCLLGYKKYRFTDEYYKLLEILENLNGMYDIHLVMLYLVDHSLYSRVHRDKVDNILVESSTRKCIEQQAMYRDVADFIIDNEDSPIKVHMVPTDTMESWNTVLKSLFVDS